jgi:hypothetical protein
MIGSSSMMLVAKTPADTIKSKSIGMSDILNIGRGKMAAGAFHVAGHTVTVAEIRPGYHRKQIWL